MSASCCHRGLAGALTDCSAQALAATDSHIHYIDCSAGLTNATGIDRSILEDALHPNAAGYDKIFACVAPVVDRLMLAAAATASAGACPSVAEAKAAAAALLAGSNASVTAQARHLSLRPAWTMPVTKGWQLPMVPGKVFLSSGDVLAPHKYVGGDLALPGRRNHGLGETPRFFKSVMQPGKCRVVTDQHSQLAGAGSRARACCRARAGRADVRRGGPGAARHGRRRVRGQRGARVAQPGACAPLGCDHAGARALRSLAW